MVFRVAKFNPNKLNELNKFYKLKIRSY